MTVVTGNGKPPKALEGVTPASAASLAMDLDETIPPGQVIELAANCVRFVLASLKIELDFSRDTLSLLDHYVAQAREDVADRPEALALMAHAIGAYLGEVARKNHACWWRIDRIDPGGWRLEFRNVYLAFYPVQVAYAALMREDDETGFSGFELPDDDRDALHERLEHLPGVDEESFYAPSTRLDILDIAVDALLAKRAQDPSPARPYAPDDYA